MYNRQKNSCDGENKTKHNSFALFCDFILKAHFDGELSKSSFIDMSGEMKYLKYWVIVQLIFFYKKSANLPNLNPFNCYIVKLYFFQTKITKVRKFSHHLTGCNSNVPTLIGPTIFFFTLKHFRCSSDFSNWYFWKTQNKLGRIWRKI